MLSVVVVMAVMEDGELSSRVNPKGSIIRWWGLRGSKVNLHEGTGRDTDDGNGNRVCLWRKKEKI